MSVATFTKSGTRLTSPVKLDKKVFGVDIVNHQLLKDVYVAYLAGQRSVSAKTKTRGEVRGGGRKPWRQKGTGNARFGSRRNPIWRGGGVAFGPTGEQNFNLKINAKAKRRALRQALTLAATSSKIIIIEAFESNEGRLKPAKQLLEKVGAKGYTLIVVGQKDIFTKRCVANLESVKLLEAGSLNVFEILNADTIVITKDSLEMINKWLMEDK